MTVVIVVTMTLTPVMLVEFAPKNKKGKHKNVEKAEHSETPGHTYEGTLLVVCIIVIIISGTIYIYIFFFIYDDYYYRYYYYHY